MDRQNNTYALDIYNESNKVVKRITGFASYEEAESYGKEYIKTADKGTSYGLVNTVYDDYIARTEYVLHVYDSKDYFNRQIDVFTSYEEAEKFASEHPEELSDGESYGIVSIDYDEDGEEIGIGNLAH